MDLRFERGVPTDEELAAIVGVLLTRSAPPVPDEPPASRWALSGRRRSGLPASWRSSALPTAR